MDASKGHRLRWHGFLILMIALVLGFPTTFAPHGRAWMAAHLTAFIGSLIVLAVAFVWQDLRLSPGQQKAAFTTLLLGVYANLGANVFGAIVNLPGPATQPGVYAPRWEWVVFSLFSAVLVPSLLTAIGLVLHGLRRDAKS